MSIEEFITQLGSSAPAPGGGAAAGVSLSLGAACAEKATRFSLSEDTRAFLAEFEKIKKMGLIFCQQDQDNFLEWQKARQLPRETEAEKKTRREKVNFYALECTKVPFNIGQYSILLLETIERFVPFCNKWLISDAAVGAAHAASALEASIFNIMINLPYVKDVQLINELKSFLNGHGEKTNPIKEKIYKLCEEILQ